MTSDQLDLSSLEKALDREFRFGRKKKKTWNHTLGSHYEYEVPLFSTLRTQVSFSSRTILPVMGQTVRKTDYARLHSVKFTVSSKVN